MDAAPGAAEGGMSMGVFIKGMKMPESCHQCVAGYGGFCFVAPPETDGKCPHEGRAPWCPLVSVPPHGDLVDMSARVDAQYFDEMTEEWSVKTVTVEDVLWGACEKIPPTIIEADDKDINVPSKEGET